MVKIKIEWNHIDWCNWATHKHVNGAAQVAARGFDALAQLISIGIGVFVTWAASRTLAHDEWPCKKYKFFMFFSGIAPCTRAFEWPSGGNTIGRVRIPPIVVRVKLQFRNYSEKWHKSIRTPKKKKNMDFEKSTFHSGWFCCCRSPVSFLLFFIDECVSIYCSGTRRHHTIGHTMRISARTRTNENCQSIIWMNPKHKYKHAYGSHHSNFDGFTSRCGKYMYIAAFASIQTARHRWRALEKWREAGFRTKRARARHRRHTNVATAVGWEKGLTTGMCIIIRHGMWTNMPMSLWIYCTQQRCECCCPTCPATCV